MPVPSGASAGFAEGSGCGILAAMMGIARPCAMPSHCGSHHGRWRRGGDRFEHHAVHRGEIRVARGDLDGRCYIADLEHGVQHRAVAWLERKVAGDQSHKARLCDLEGEVARRQRGEGELTFGVGAGVAHGGG